MPKKENKKESKKASAASVGMRGKKIWMNLGEETRTRIRKITGLVVGAFTIFTLISVISYLFTWEADSSLLSADGLLPKGAKVENWGGSIGFRWSRFLVCRCFGLGSFALIFLLWTVFVRLFFKNRPVRFLRAVVLTLTGACLSSVILSYVCSRFCDDLFFGGGLGGDCGAEVVSLSVALMGPVMPGVLLVVLMMVWLVFASARFSRWFSELGDSYGRRNEDSVESDQSMADGGSSADGSVVPDSGAEETRNLDSEEFQGLDSETLPDQETGVSEESYEGDVLPQTGLADAGNFTADDFPGDDLPENELPENELPSDDLPELPEDRGSQPSGVRNLPADSSLEIIKGDGFSTDVKKELPRIDVRDELSKYVFPPLDLLKDYSSGRHEVSPEELERNNAKIRVTLQNYKIQIDKVSACVGPTVTLYRVVPAPGVRISTIKSREEDIAVALGVKGVRVVTLADSVGIEVPNDRSSIVPLKSMLNDDAFRNTKYELPIAIGYTITQKVKTFDLADAPHLLVAGATKQGKSVGLNVIIASLLYAKHPSELKLVFIDPKMVEFNAYAKLLKHYLAVLPTASSEKDEMASAIVKQAKQAEQILRSLCIEMDDRYELMSRTSANNVKLYNEKYKSRFLNPNEGHRFLPYIVVVIDEFSDLIMSQGAAPEAKATARSISTSIIRLAQKGRAAGIHVIIATQRPSVDVITGSIKTNFPTRIAFRTIASVDSKTILDSPGAEKLIGRGDMLYYAGVEMERVQCALIEMDEICRITDFIGSQTGYKQCYNTPYYLPSTDSAEGGEEGQGMVDMSNLDEAFRTAAEMVVIDQKGSTSTLQRKLGMGFARAGRVMDQLEAAGIVGPQEGSKPRQVLVKDLEELRGILDAFMPQ